MLLRNTNLSEGEQIKTTKLRPSLCWSLPFWERKENIHFNQMFVPRLETLAKGILMQYPHLSLVYQSLVQVRDYTREGSDCLWNEILWQWFPQQCLQAQLNEWTRDVFRRRAKGDENHQSITLSVRGRVPGGGVHIANFSWPLVPFFITAVGRRGGWDVLEPLISRKTLLLTV